MRIVLDENGIVSQEDLAGRIEDKSKGAWINISSIDIIDTLENGWQLLTILPREELDRVDTKILDKYYKQGE